MNTDLDHFKQHFASVKEQEFKVPGVHARISSLSWSCDGNKLATASSDGIVRVFDMNVSGGVRELVKLSDTGKNYCVAFHPTTPKVLAVCDRRLQIYDSASGQLLHETEQDISSRPLNIAFNTDGTVIAVGTKAEEVYCFGVDGGLLFRWMYKCAFEANQFQFTLENDILLSSGPGNLRCLSKDGHSLLYDFPCANGPSLSVAHCKQYTVVGSADATITIFANNSNTLDAVSVIARPEWPVRHVTLSHDHQFLAAAGDDRHIDIACMPHGDSVHRVAVDGVVLACRWHPTKYLLAYAPEKVDKNGRPELLVKIFGYPQL